MLGSIIDKAQQVAIILLCGCIWPRHKDQLLAEAAPAWEPSLSLPCVRVHPGESLHLHIIIEPGRLWGRGVGYVCGDSACYRCHEY